MAERAGRTSRRKTMPEWSRVSQIEASPFDAGTAYVAVDRHQNDDLKPYIFKTSDYGKTWTKLTQRNSGYDVCARGARRSEEARAALCGHRERSLRFVQRWSELASAETESADVRRCMIWSSRDDDLVVATHGRAFWILDDLSPLRQFSGRYRAEGRASVHAGDGLPHSGGAAANGDASKRTGQNPPAGSGDLLLPEGCAEGGHEAEIEILDASGKSGSQVFEREAQTPRGTARIRMTRSPRSRSSRKPG